MSIDWSDPRERLDTDDLEEMAVIASGQADDLHYEDDFCRVWLSRTGVADGEPFENTVTVEARDSRGRWVTEVIYDGDNPTETQEV